MKEYTIILDMKKTMKNHRLILITSSRLLSKGKYQKNYKKYLVLNQMYLSLI